MEEKTDTSSISTIEQSLIHNQVIEAIRTYTLLNADNLGFPAATKDPRLGKALSSFHKAPENNWSVQTLSEEAAMSRSAFADQFKQMVGMTPMEYVTGWRMQQAYDALTADNSSVTQIAETCGYQSEPAFRKALKKQFGVGPGAVRREAKGSIEQPSA